MASSSHHPGWLSESESDDDSLSSPSLKRPASEAVQEEPKMKTTESKKSNGKRVWSEEDELAVLKGLVDYRIKTGLEPRLDYGGFYRFVGSSIVAKVSKDQVVKKISHLKGRFLVKSEQIDQGEDLVFIKPRDAEAFGFSKMIWGTNDAEVPDNRKETLKEDEVVANAKPLDEKETANEEVAANAKPVDENEAAKEEVAANAKPLDENEAANPKPLDVYEAAREEVAANAKPLDVNEAANDKPSDVNEAAKENVVANARPLDENEAAKKDVAVNVESLNENKGDDDDDAADELCGVRDAFDAMIPQGLSEYQKKFQLAKLMKVVSKKRKELSDEWKALCNEEVKLKIKKHKFCGKLADAVNDS